MPSKAGKKGKKKGPPPPDKAWDKAINSGVWERPLEVLPDPLIHPSFKEMREKILSAVGKISIQWSDCEMMNGFVQELFNSSRDKLVSMELRGAFFLTKIIISPSTIVPSLKTLDFSCCEALDYVFLQCASLENLSLHRCPSLRKVILHTKRLKDVDLLRCEKLSVLILWSDSLSSFHLDPSVNPSQFKTLQLHCPNLKPCEQ